MSQPALWELVRSAAYDLNRSGKVPFTRQDLIALVQKSRRSAQDTSINPIIQGVTTNLKGGAPGSVGKNILRSVGRNQFVLNGQKTHQPPRPVIDEPGRRTSPKSGSAANTPGTEGELQALIMSMLKREFSTMRLTRNSARQDRFEMTNGQVCLMEGALPYALTEGNKVSHKSDFLVFDPKQGRYLSIELKYKSAVTDQFKCRAFDALHLKREYGDNIRTVMLYVRAGKGISLKQARAISYQFDHFIGTTIEDVMNAAAIPELDRIVSEFLHPD